MKLQYRWHNNPSQFVNALLLPALVLPVIASPNLPPYTRNNNINAISIIYDNLQTHGFTQPAPQRPGAV